ncbi:MAG TPA: hypothetical protein VN923_10550, partial [Thermoanaerobaculia bacterium]|nr:hypothetical protein [Thermoanaerobaculia bacterium]
ERGLVERGQLLEALRLQTYRLLLQLLRWDQGDFKFYSGEEVAFEEGFYAISIEELLIRSLSDLGNDDQVGGPPDLALAYERVPGAQPVQYLKQDGAVPEGSGVWIAAEDRPFVERLDGKTPVGTLADATGVGHYRALFTLYKLLRAGAVRAVKGAGATAAPATAASTRTSVAAPAAAARTSAATAASAAAPRSAVPAPTFGVKPDDEELPEIAPAPAATGRVRQMVARTVPVSPGVLAVVVPRLAALFVAIVVFASPWLAPRRLLLPFPWQEQARAGLERNQRSALYLQIDRAARTFFLLEGHYPDGLQELVAANLLGPTALADPGGRRLAYSAENLAYEVQPVVGGEPVAELGVREAITGDFLLDPDFLDLPEKPERPPLVLLD